MRLVAILLLSVVAGCATAHAQRARNSDLAEPRQGSVCTAAAPSDFRAQRAETERALREAEPEYAAMLAQADRPQSAKPAEDDTRLENLTRAYAEARRRVLRPLAALGNAEAMMRLAQEFRDSDQREDIALWFGLVTCASSLGHPMAHDELARFYWHQRGDGSIAYVQHSRAIALSYAGEAAAARNMFSLNRIATYIAGNVHQYPADLPLAHRLMELCARADGELCQQALATGSPYDFGESPLLAHLWYSRLAARQPEQFAVRRDAAWRKLTPEQQQAASRDEAAWRPIAWADLQPEWLEIRDEILATGQSSIGADTQCTTETPWCRGRGVIP